MYKIIKFTLLSLCLMLPQVVYGQSLPETIRLTGDANKLHFTETTEPGFLYEQEFLPGESIERTLVIENKKDVSFELNFQLATTQEKSEIDLLSQINIQIYNDNQLICEGVIYDNPCTLRQYYATLPPGAVRKLTMKATFDENATNIYKGLIAEYDWIFDAKVVKGSIEDPNKPNEPFVPEPNQPQTERPLAPNVQGVVKPLPNTGMYTIELLTFGIVLLVTSVIVLKKKGEREDETNKKN